MNTELNIHKVRLFTSGKASRIRHAHPAKEGVTGSERSGQKTGPGPDDSTDHNPET